MNYNLHLLIWTILFHHIEEFTDIFVVLENFFIQFNLIFYTFLISLASPTLFFFFISVIINRFVM